MGFGDEKDVKGMLFHVLRELEGFGDLADVLNIPGSYVDLFCGGVPVLVVPVVVVCVLGEWPVVRLPEEVCPPWCFVTAKLDPVWGAVGVVYWFSR